MMGMAVLIAAYVFVLPLLQARSSHLISPSDLYIPRLIDVVITVWCFWVGSSIGSFLNVVAWRMPRGESINGRSYCPSCRAQLKARDNFPVFGWIALRGRCRTCHLPISPRYPIVEGLVGLTLALVSIAELYRLALPRQYVHWHGGPFWSPVVDQPILIILLYHIVGLTMCWAFGLIRMDRNRLPSRLAGFALAVTVVPMLVYPGVMIVPWQMDLPDAWLPNGMYVDAIIRVVTALAAATFIGRYLARAFCPEADPKLDPLGKSTARLVDLIVILAIPTILVGWQAAPAVIVLASLIAALFRRWLPPTCDAMGCFAICMPFALTFQIVLWRHLHAVPEVRGEVGFAYWPSDGSPSWVMFMWLILVGLIPLWLRDSPEDHILRPSPGTDSGNGSGQRHAGKEEECQDGGTQPEDENHDNSGVFCAESTIGGLQSASHELAGDTKSFPSRDSNTHEQESVNTKGGIDGVADHPQQGEASSDWLPESPVEPPLSPRPPTGEAD